MTRSFKLRIIGLLEVEDREIHHAIDLISLYKGEALKIVERLLESTYKALQKG